MARGAGPFSGPPRRLRLMGAARWIIATLWLFVLVLVYQRIGHLAAFGALLASLIFIAIYGGHGRPGARE